MKFYKYKSGITKLAVIIVILMMLDGIAIPAVFADGTLAEGIGNTKEDQKQEDDILGEDENPDLEVELYWDVDGNQDSRGNNIWFAEEAFYHTKRPTLYYDENVYYDNDNNRRKERQFVSVTFYVYGEDAENLELEFSNLDNLMNPALIDILGESSRISMVDIDFIKNKVYQIESEYSGSEDIPEELSKELIEKKTREFIEDYIFIRDKNNRRKASLYIPVKPLMPNMEYSVKLGPDLITAIKEDGSSILQTNPSRNWTFKTMPAPAVLERNLIVESVIEDYDVMEPIIIFGKYFDPGNIEVYFNNVRAHRIRAYEDKEKRHSRANTEEAKGKNHNNKGQGDGGDYRSNDEVDQYLKVYLPRGRNKLGPGLYNITIENSRNHSIKFYGALSVVPRASRSMPREENIFGTRTPYGSVNGNSRVDLVRLDHKEPVQEEILRKELVQYSLKSPIVEAVGAYSTYIYTLEIPVEEGRYEEYKVLRYDSFSRSWLEEDFYYINKLDKRAIVAGSQPGIFVVVEPRS